MYYLLALWIIIGSRPAVALPYTALLPAPPTTVDTLPPPPPPEYIEPVEELEAEAHEEIVTVLETMPRFPGCEDFDGTDEEKKRCADQQLLKFMKEHLRYVKGSRGRGGMAVVSFTVLEDGRIANIELLRDPGYGMGKEALRVVRLMQDMPERWTPGTQRGTEVRVRFNLPVRFSAE